MRFRDRFSYREGKTVLNWCGARKKRSVRITRSYRSYYMTNDKKKNLLWRFVLRQQNVLLMKQKFNRLDEMFFSAVISNFIHFDLTVILSFLIYWQLDNHLILSIMQLVYFSYSLKKIQESFGHFICNKIILTHGRVLRIGPLLIISNHVLSSQEDCAKCQR